MKNIITKQDFIWPLLFVSIFEIGCNKPSSGNNNNNSDSTTSSANVIVHTAGHNNASMVWWKGTTATQLALVPYGSGEIKGMAFANNNLYIVGFDNNYAQAILWTNGKRQQLSSGANRAEARCIAIDGKDVYVGGYEEAYRTEGAVWKNGQQQMISGFTAIDNIKVFNGKIYLLGFSIDTLLYRTPTQTVRLAISTGGAKSMFVDGNDVYVCGNDQNQAVYWKNGQRILLSNNPGAVAADIVVANNTVYVVGIDGLGHAVLWKNEVATILHNESSYAYALAVKGNDVFVAGAIKDSQRNAAVYWHNGKFVQLGTANSQAGVFAAAIALEPK